jgi:hypothetical protein
MTNMVAGGVNAVCRAALIVIAVVMVLTPVSGLGAREGAADPGSDPRLVDGAADVALLNSKIITVASDNAIAQGVANQRQPHSGDG